MSLSQRIRTIIRALRYHGATVIRVYGTGVPTLLIGYQGKSITMTVQVKHRYDWPMVQDAASALQYLGIFYASRSLAEIPTNSRKLLLTPEAHR